MTFAASWRPKKRVVPLEMLPPSYLIWLLNHANNKGYVYTYIYTHINYDIYVYIVDTVDIYI